MRRLITCSACVCSALLVAATLDHYASRLPEPEATILLDRLDLAADAYTGDRRRPQAIVRNDAGEPVAMLVSLREPREDGVSISTAIAWTDDAGETWRAGPVILDTIQGTWQGDRAFGTAIARDGDRWVMASCGNDETGATPGIRSVGIWSSDDLVTWEPYADNPVMTIVDLSPMLDQFPGELVGLYMRDMQRIDGRWLGLMTARGDHGSWASTVIVEAEKVTGPWTPVGLAVAEASRWLGLNANVILSQPTRIDGRWYAVTRNGVGATHRENNRFGIAVSDDYLTWTETGFVSPPMLRAHTRGPIVAAQCMIVGRNNVIVSARGNWNRDALMYQWTGAIDGVW